MPRAEKPSRMQHRLAAAVSQLDTDDLMNAGGGSMTDAMLDVSAMRRLAPQGAAAAASLIAAQQKPDREEEKKPAKLTTTAAAAAKVSWDKLSNQMSKLEKRKLKTDAFKQSVAESAASAAARQEAAKHVTPKVQSVLAGFSSTLISTLPSEAELLAAARQETLDARARAAGLGDTSLRGASQGKYGDVVSSTSSSSGAAGANTTMSRLQRENVEAAERKKLNLVLQHPAFLMNPLDAIREHMSNELALTRAREIASKEVDKAKRKSEAAAAAAKASASKPSSAGQSSKPLFQGRR